MAHFQLSFSGNTDNPEDLGIFGMLAGLHQRDIDLVLPAAAGAQAEQPAPKTRGKAKVDPAVAAAQNGDATKPLTPAQPVRATEPAVDPAIAAAQAGDANAKNEPTEAEMAAAILGDTTETPSASAPTDITMQTLKDLLSQGIGSIGAAKCLTVLKGLNLDRIGEATEEQFGDVHAALTEAIAAG